jgi:hypothetical protein
MKRLLLTAVAAAAISWLSTPARADYCTGEHNQWNYEVAAICQVHLDMQTLISAVQAGGGGGGGGGGAVTQSGVWHFTLDNPSIPVTGTFWQSVQPVSESGTWTVGINNFPAVQPVSGTFWQATQPVSMVSLPPFASTPTVNLGTLGGAATAAKQDSIIALLTAPLSVTGTFWPATQPVSQSGAWTVGVNNFPASQAVTGPLTDLQLRASSVPVSGPLTDVQLRATAVPISAVSLPLPAGSATAAKQDSIIALLTAPLTVTWPSALPVSIASMPTTPVSQSGSWTDTVNQGTSPWATRDLKDNGRTYVILSYDRVTGITTEALVTMTINKGGTVTTGTAYTVTAGKTLRCGALYAEVLNTTTVVNRSLVRVRVAATVSASSPVIGASAASAPAAVATSLGSFANQFPDGVEIAAGQQIGMSHLESVTTAGIASAVLTCYEY